MLVGGDSDVGSFWTTFQGLDGNTTPETSPLETLLQDPTCSVEAILQEENVIQEFKACNEKLVNRLCSPDALSELFQIITCEPADDASDGRKFRYPFVAVELISCGSDDFFEVIADPKQSDALRILWDFLYDGTASDVNPTLAGYFARAAALVFEKRSEQVVDYLRGRGAQALFDKFLQRLHLRSLAELFARLLHAEDSSRNIFSTADLVSRILLQFQADANAQENASLIIMELLTHKDFLCFGEDLLRQLTCETVVRTLVDCMLSESHCGPAAATSILSTIVFHTSVGMVLGGNLPHTPTMTPLSPPPPLTGDDDMVNVGFDDGLPEEVAIASRTSPPTSPSRSNSGTPARVAEWLQVRSTILMRDLGVHLSRIQRLLDDSLQRRTVQRMPIGEVSAVGPNVLELINFLTMIVKTGRSEIFEAMLKEEIAPRCMEVFFQHPWSSVLHNSIRLFISEILSLSADLILNSVRSEVVVAMLREGGLAERLVAEYAAEETSKSANYRHRHARVGYMGHLHAISREIREFAEKSEQCNVVLDAVPGWSTVVLPALAEVETIYGQELGGGVRDSDRNLASSGLDTHNVDSAVTSVASNSDIDDDDDDDDDCLPIPGDSKLRVGKNFGSDDWDPNHSDEIVHTGSSDVKTDPCLPDFSSSSSAPDGVEWGSFGADFSLAPPGVSDRWEPTWAGCDSIAPAPTPAIADPPQHTKRESHVSQVVPTTTSPTNVVTPVPFDANVSLAPQDVDDKSEPTRRGRGPPAPEVTPQSGDPLSPKERGGDERQKNLAYAIPSQVAPTMVFAADVNKPEPFDADVSPAPRNADDKCDRTWPGDGSVAPEMTPQTVSPSSQKERGGDGRHRSEIHAMPSQAERLNSAGSFWDRPLGAVESAPVPKPSLGGLADEVRKVGGDAAASFWGFPTSKVAATIPSGSQSQSPAWALASMPKVKTAPPQPNGASLPAQSQTWFEPSAQQTGWANVASQIPAAHAPGSQQFQAFPGSLVPPQQSTPGSNSCPDRSWSADLIAQFDPYSPGGDRRQR